MTRNPPTHLTVSEIENIKVLKASGLTHYAISKRVGRSVKCIKRCSENPRNAEEIKEIQSELAGYFEDLTMRLLTSISDSDIDKLSGYQRMISAGISVDKSKLLRNESTHNVSLDVIHSNMAERQKRRQELLAELGEFAEV